MRTTLSLLTAAILVAVRSLDAQTFSSGSTGADGALNITTDTTLPMPANGVFNFTTINVAGGATLRFSKNSLNTPVYLLATGNVSIVGSIDISGSNANGGAAGVGGPGGFDGGTGGFGIGASTNGGDGLGPGGGPAGTYYDYGRSGVFSMAYQGNTRIYGNALLSPLIGGSGGGGASGNPGYGGGGGGGAILIASSTTITIAGSISANGGSGPGSYASFGSAGAIRLVAPVVGGSGSLYAQSSTPGRIRIDCTDRTSYRQLSYNGVASRGSQMFVFPAVQPRLSVIEAAGQTIAEGTQNSVEVDLPAGSSQNRTVKVRARDFTGTVPIRVVVTPENGASTTYDAQLDMSAGNPVDTSVDVVIPVGGISRIQAWTR